MANRAQQPPSANPDAAAAALGRMQLGDRGPQSAPAVPRMPPGRPGVGGLKRNKPGFKLSDITGDDTSSAANAGLGAGAPSLARQEWQPRKPVAGTPFANFRKIVCVLILFRVYSWISSRLIRASTGCGYVSRGLILRVGQRRGQM